MAARKKSARKKSARKKTARKSTRKQAGAKSGAEAKGGARKKAGKSGGRAKAARRGGATKVKRQRAAVAPEAAFPEIEELAQLMERHGLHEVAYSRDADGSTSLHVSKGAFSPLAPLPAAAPAPAPAAGPASGADASDAPAPPAAPEEQLHAFKSPMVGTFYRAPSPEAAPFSTTGDVVDPSSVVCIIEAMKVMNEINPDIAGEIVSIEVENGEAVEFGQTLMLIRPR